jgi:hypothetical protein
VVEERSTVREERGFCSKFRSDNRRRRHSSRHGCEPPVDTPSLQTRCRFCRQTHSKMGPQFFGNASYKSYTSTRGFPRIWGTDRRRELSRFRSGGVGEISR